MQLYTIDTGLFKLDGGAMFGSVPKSLWNKLHPADANNMCTWASRSILIEDGSQLILIDNGIGTKETEKFLSHYYLHGDDSLSGSIKKHGFHEDDITDVILTHFHFDHCGGSTITKDGKPCPTFKNARYWTNELQWQHATTGGNDFERPSFLQHNILPLQQHNVLNFLSLEGYSTKTHLSMSFTDKRLPNIKFRIASGHTIGMMLPEFTYKGMHFIFCADLVPSINFVPIRYVCGYDTQILQSLQEKKQLAQDYVGTDKVLIFQHDPFNECCTLKSTDKGVVADKIFKIADI
ncbi:MAG: MBL fold metallo-hydrolase [Phycisphaerales bacterium]|nr:MBL fold metallo-hydrolase [Phycisphaerales bacterium]